VEVESSPRGDRDLAAIAVGCFRSSLAPLAEKPGEENLARRDLPDVARRVWKPTKTVGIIA